MRMYDLITKKKHGGELSLSELRYMIGGYVQGEIADYQMAAMLMAVWFQGMTDAETAGLTQVMAASGDQVDLSPIPGLKVDKHSTGGVGDKTTLVVAPIVAACGGKVAKMSGRGLGHTGGTVDKLEAIPGLRTSLSQAEFFRIVKENGLAVVGQSGDLAPADKKLYALRDVTATVDSIPLIASSIMSKKLAAGSDCILLDVKLGSGAFMKTLPDAEKLARTMVNIGEAAGRRTVALITDMDVPLGNAIGNALEVTEAVDTLRGRGPADLTAECIQLAANMLYLVGKGDIAYCRELSAQALANGTAFGKLCAMTAAQGGDTAVLYDTGRFVPAAHRFSVTAAQSGYITHMNAEQCGIASVVLGAGRETKDSVIDMAAGIRMLKKYGDAVSEGEPIAWLYANEAGKLAEAARVYSAAITIGREPPPARPLIYARIEKEKNNEKTV